MDATIAPAAPKAANRVAAIEANLVVAPGSQLVTFLSHMHELPLAAKQVFTETMVRTSQSAD